MEEAEDLMEKLHISTQEVEEVSQSLAAPLAGEAGIEKARREIR